MVHERLDSKKGPLGLKFVGKYDEKRIPVYPAIVILPGPREKELHASHTFQILFHLNMYVYHGDITLTKRERSKEDLVLVANIERELESDYEWQLTSGVPASKRVIFAYVSSIRPGNLQPSTRKSPLIIGTQMTWRALSQRRFDA